MYCVPQLRLTEITNHVCSLSPKIDRQKNYRNLGQQKQMFPAGKTTVQVQRIRPLNSFQLLVNEERKTIETS